VCSPCGDTDPGYLPNHKEWLLFKLQMICEKIRADGLLFFPEIPKAPLVIMPSSRLSLHLHIIVTLDLDLFPFRPETVSSNQYKIFRISGTDLKT